VRTDEKTLKDHAADKWMASHLPDVVVFADSTRCVSQVMQFAGRHRVPVTVRGGGVGYVGGCVPVKGGIVLSLIRMNRIRELNVTDGIAIAEAGVITETLQKAARLKGLFYPPDPASLKDSTIGGNIATNAGGPRCLKYGVTGHYVLGLEVVLPSGEVIEVGGRTHKNKVGFSLPGLFIGSEGLLGVVTAATVGLIPHPPTRACLSTTFATERQAARMVVKILGHGFLPSALEVADSLTLEAARKYFQSQGKGETAEKMLHGKAHLLLEVDGRKDSVRSEIRDLERFLRKNGAISPKVAFGDTACEKLWDLRREFSTALKATGLPKMNEDVVVPRRHLVSLFEFARKLQRKYGNAVACFGHAGDGNIHVNIMVDLKDSKKAAASRKALDELFRQVLAWGGTITGEHGIGLAKKKWWPLAVSVPVRRLHEQLKAMLDPRGILNPGKFVGR
jgi:glycolate oxidase subunit GlcD